MFDLGWTEIEIASSGFKSVTDPAGSGLNVVSAAIARRIVFMRWVAPLSAVLRENLIGEAALLAAIGFIGVIIAGFVR